MKTRNIDFEPIQVVTDGGSRDGCLALIDQALIAVFVQVSAEEGGNGSISCGWFREAGFGPCSDLMTVNPPVFATLDEAAEWVCDRVNTGLPQG